MGTCRGVGGFGTPNSHLVEGGYSTPHQALGTKYSAPHQRVAVATEPPTRWVGWGTLPTPHPYPNLTPNFE